VRDEVNQEENEPDEVDRMKQEAESTEDDAGAHLNSTRSSLMATFIIYRPL